MQSQYLSRATRVEPEKPEDGNKEPEWKCVNPGIQCKSCDIAMNCMDIGAADLIEIDTPCPSGQTCNAGQCTDKPNFECSGASDVAFPCTAVGVFPNPSSCRSYFVCIKDGEKTFKPSKTECVGDYAYDPITTYCKFPIAKNGTCPVASSVPLCQTLGQTGALSNKSIFYICLKIDATKPNVLYPKLFLCANGKTYANGRCS